MKNNPIAYEWHNLKTGHAYVDYIRHPDLEFDGEYTQTPLYKIEQEPPKECKSVEEIFIEYIGNGQYGVDFDKKHILEAMESYHAQFQTEQGQLIANSGRKYRSIPDDMDIETWDNMTVTERMRYKGLIGEIIAERQVTDEDIEKWSMQDIKVFSPNDSDAYFDVAYHARIKGAKAMRDNKIGKQ